MRDSLGMPVDEMIAPLVVALRWHGFETSASCEGHLDRGCPWPWIDFEPSSGAIPRGTSYARRVALLSHEVARLWRLVAAFSCTRPVSAPRFVIVLDRLQPEGTPLVPEDASDENFAEHRLVERQAEATRFAAWLLNNRSRRVSG
jgi:hypothetical protein